MVNEKKYCTTCDPPYVRQLYGRLRAAGEFFC